MDGIVRIEHDIDNDQLQLLGSGSRGARLPSYEDCVGCIRKTVDGVHVDGSDVVLAYAFSNLMANACYQGSSRSTARTLMVYPLHDERVGYRLKPGDYLASMQGDPITIFLGNHASASAYRSMVLLGKNPFRDTAYRPDVLSTLLLERIPLQPKNWRRPLYSGEPDR